MNNSETYICIKQFNARLGDELTLKIGDKIQVLADDHEYNDGWFMGKNMLTGEVGLYPKSFTELLTRNTEDKTLLRSRSRRVMTPKQNEILNDTQNISTNSTVQSKSNNAPSISSNLNPNINNNSNSNDSTSHINNEIDKALEEIQGNNNSNNNNNNNNYKQSNVTANNNYNKQHIRTTSAQSLTDDLNPLQANNWTPKQVSSYFHLVLGYDKEIASKFSKHRISGPILFELDLGYLKELEIDSFGTRFEINKEIEKLKQMNLRSQKLKQQSRTNSQSTGSTSNKIDTTSSTVNSSPTELTTFQENEHDKESNHQQQQNILHSVRSNQNELMPSAVIGNNTGASLKHQRKRSQSMDNLSQHFDSSFISPRKPPQPPLGESPMDTNYKFGSGSQALSNEEPIQGLYVTRTNASNHGVGNSRPASSVYDQASNHNRQISQTSNYRQHHKKTSSTANHKRHSSLFSFLSGNEDDSNKPKYQSKNIQKDDYRNENEKLISPAQIKRDNNITTSVGGTPKRKSQLYDYSNSPVDIDDANMSPKKSNSMKSKSIDALKDDRRVASEPQSNLTNSRPQASRLKSFRTVSTQNFRNMTGSKKSKTSAFTEGIREVTPDEAIKTANHSGYMSKRSSNTLGWRQRYFTLHGTRLSYFTSLKDKREKGLIDITAHKVIPINSEADDLDKADKYAAMYASTTLAGSFCFKIVPPAPGFKKGLTFTQPKTHYFAVESEEDMRGWIKALMTATIDIDDSVPVVSSCSTPTVSLSKAQEMLAKTREENKLKDEELRAKGYIRGDEDFSNDTSFQSSMYSTSTLAGSHGGEKHTLPKLTINTQNNRHSNLEAPPLTPNLQTKSSNAGPSSGGFASPYLLASGYLSPKSGTTSSPNETPTTTNSGYFGDPHQTLGNFKPPSRQNSQNHTNVNTTSASTPNVNNPYTTINTNRFSSNISSTPYSTASSNNSQSNVINPVTHINGNGDASSPKDISNNTTSSINSTPSSNNKAIFANSTGKLLSGVRKKEKMMAFSSDGSGNHTFVIKSKK
ncbi:BOI2 [Candida jiufengensis]|uniref:BOI2 n=1 Tax=Candida jiufengensis TaxID=497108 RepID=UPI00222495B9|nr:BOI2 [Candida jiufengensis]KAI5951078.1 BOI2 [Candida jiufengensis]